MEPKSVTIEMNIREEKKHSVRFRCTNEILDSIYLNRRALINQFGSDRISKITLTIEVEMEE